MLLYLAELLAARWPDLFDWHALAPVALRAALAAAITFVLALVMGPTLIGWLAGRLREPVKSDSPLIAQLHAPKNNTATMGGLLIVGGLVVGLLVCGDWRNPYLPIAAMLAVALCAVGACDDWIKVTTHRHGMSARAKLAAQAAIALAAAMLVYRCQVAAGMGSELTVPLAGTVELGPLLVPLAALVMVASSNAVNLTDGLDGLAGGCLISATGALAVIAYVSGHAGWSAQFGMPHVVGAGEVSVLAAAIVGGSLAFLWFNCHPASVFMGDAGSLPLGGLLGFVAVVARQELLLLVIGGVFVVEAVSVIAQVAAVRWLGRRVLRCAPLHHHFQLMGWPEDKIVVRFWIASALCATLGLAILNLHTGGPIGIRQVSTSSSQETPSRAELLGGLSCPSNILPARADRRTYERSVSQFGLVRPSLKNWVNRSQ